MPQNETEARLESLKNELKTELENNILPYWTDKAADRVRGGFYGLVRNDNSVDSNAPKGLVMHARFLWSYASAYRIYRYQPYFHAAEHARKFLIGSLADGKNGGYFWQCDAAGEPTVRRKYIYGQAFAIYGLSEYSRAGGPGEAGRNAIELFDILEDKARDHELGGYYEALEEDWTFTGKVNLGDEDPGCVKSMNTNLHVLEAYTNLYRVFKNERVREALESLINVAFSQIIDPSTFHLKLFFDREWKHSGNIDSYGHDIEASWLLWEALEVLGDDELKERNRARIISMADTAVAEGLAGDFGLNYETVNGKPDTDRHWWPQAEMIIGMFNAWQLTDDLKYLDMAEKVWEFTRNNIIAENGEWYWARRADGSLLKDEKGGIWKTPYHNGRLCMELIERIDNITK